VNQVFISYSLKSCAACAAGGACGPGHGCRLTSEFLAKLVERLKPSFDVKWDRDILFAGDDWRKKLYSFLGECQAAVILLTEGAFDSNYVPLEAMVLMYRHVLNPHFKIIPVYFANVSAERVRVEKPFYGIGLDDINAVTHGGNDESCLRAIEDTLRVLAKIPSPEKVAVLQRLVELLDGISDHAAVAAAQEWGESLEEADGPKPLQLARRLMDHELLDATRALNQIPLEPGRRSKILDLLAPAWVNLLAAAPIWKDRWVASPAEDVPKKGPVFVINGKFEQTAAHYVRRAWSLRRDEELGILPVAAIAGQSAEDIRNNVLRAFWKDYIPSAGEDHGDAGDEMQVWDEECRDDALDTLKLRVGSSRVPVHAIFQHSPGLNPKALAEAQKLLPEVTMVYLCNGQVPKEEDGYCETKPELSAADEKRARNTVAAAFSTVSKK
jgi:hypothetical protein